MLFSLFKILFPPLIFQLISILEVIHAHIGHTENINVSLLSSQGDGVRGGGTTATHMYRIGSLINGFLN